jgi:HAD superfamily hydrolase (TIGR01490 family)
MSPWLPADVRHEPSYDCLMAGAAFFDLDRTLIRRSSALALAGSFRRHGVIGRRQLAKAAVMQLLFVVRGADEAAVRKASEEGPALLRGFSTERLRALVDTALEPTLRPLVYPKALELARWHQRRGERVYIVSSTLQEIVDALAADLGFDGALGLVCEQSDGVYTGRAARTCHGAGKADAVRELAADQNIDLGRSTAYSDSASDLPLLETVGFPVAVNPDRKLRRVADQRGWPLRVFEGARAA